MDVYFDGKRTGTIKPKELGFAYFPIGSKMRGEVFFTIKQVKVSL